MTRRPVSNLCRLTAFALALVGVACSGDGGGVEWVAVRDTVGDTIVVRTTAGSIWGSSRVLTPEVSIGVLEGADAYMFGSVAAIAVTSDERVFVLDRQIPQVRLFGPDGIHIRDVGRSGEGPGEYKRPDGGMVFMPDGRLVLRDPGTGKILEFSADGEHVRDVRLPYGGGFNTSNNFSWDAYGNLYTPTILNLADRVSVTDWVHGLIRFGPDRSVLDSLETPTYDFDPWIVSGETEGNSSSTGVPYAPGVETAFSPLGYWVAGLSTDYRIDLRRTDAPLDPFRAAVGSGTGPPPGRRGPGAPHTRELPRAVPGLELERTGYSGPQAPILEPAGERRGANLGGRRDTERRAHERRRGGRGGAGDREPHEPIRGAAGLRRVRAERGLPRPRRSAPGDVAVATPRGARGSRLGGHPRRARRAAGDPVPDPGAR